MATATTAPRVRLVRCPKCLLVLPEVADVPVYKCGGCGTILVAKNRKVNAKSASALQGTEAAASNESVRVSEHGESSSPSTLHDVLPSLPESRSSQERGGDRDVHTGSCSEEQGENVLVEGRRDGRHDKDQNMSRDGEGGGACAMLDENRSIDSRSEEHDEGLSVNGCCEKDQKLSRYSEGDGACAMLDENRSTGSRSKHHNEGLSVEGGLDGCYDKDRNMSRDSEGDGACAMLDENRSTGSRSEEHGEDLSVEGGLNGCYEKDRNTFRESEGDGACAMLDENRSTDFRSEEHDEGLLVEGGLNGCYEKDQNMSRDSEGDGACAMLDANRSTDSRSEKHGEDSSVEGGLNGRHDKDQNISRDSEGNGASAMLDENISTDCRSEEHNEDLSVEGGLNGCDKKDRNTFRESDGDGACAMLDENIAIDSRSEEHGEDLSVEGGLNGCYEKDQNVSRDSEGDGACAMLDENRSTGSRSEQHDEGLSLEGGLDGCYDKNQNTFRESDGDGESDPYMLDENRSIDSLGDEHGENVSVQGELDGHYEKDQNKSGDCDGDGDGESMLDENRSNEGKKNGTGLLRTESSEHYNGSLEAEAHDMTSRLGGAKSELEASNKVDSDTLGSRRGEHRVVHGIRSTDTFDSVDFFSLGSEFSEPAECLSKSTTIRSSHAYDGSISSFDGRDDHFPNQRLHSYENDYKPAIFSSDLFDKKHYETKNYRTWRRDGSIELPGNQGLESDQYPSHRMPLPQSASLHGYEGAGPSSESRYNPLELHRNWPGPERDQYTSPIPLPSRERKHPSQIPLPRRASLRCNESAGPSRELRDEPLEPPRSRPISERHQYPSSIHLPQRASLRGNENAGPSRELRDELPFDSALHQFERATHGDEENIKLLRMVNELQDQISKTCHLNGNTRTDVPWNKSHFDTYNHHEEPPEDAYHGRHDLSRRTRFSRVPFSGGAIDTRHEIDNTCLCCHPQATHHSEQLHPHMFPHNRGICRGGTDHSCYNSYSSCPSTPQRNLVSEIPNWTHETKSDDQMYREHELKRYSREKHHAVRRHIRPTAGGAPFVTCYHCIRPLQLPADFLLFKKRFHQLRCGSCSKVLKFSLRNGTQIVPYELVVEAPPPSEVEDRGDAINIRISGLASSSDVSAETDPSSYSDEYGHSFDISCSTDGNPLSKPMETSNSAGSSRSKKASSEIEGSPSRTRVSPLHRLMGYSTLSQVLRRNRPSISDTSSIHSSKTKD